jgi:hypothetical protein
MASHIEQEIEIALEPKRAFENGDIGAPRLRAPPSRREFHKLLGGHLTQIRDVP